MQAYCMKCRTRREIKEASDITTKNGKPATQGVCPVCGTKIFRIGAIKPASDISAKMSWDGNESSMRAPNFEPPPGDIPPIHGRHFEPPPGGD
jgi:hypothetical protein